MTSDVAPDIFGEVEAALPEGWYITLLERFESDEGVWWGAAAEKVEDDIGVVEEAGQGDTPALALRDLVRRFNK